MFIDDFFNVRINIVGKIRSVSARMCYTDVHLDGEKTLAFGRVQIDLPKVTSPVLQHTLR